MAAPIVQYIVVRGDLIKQLQWPLGSVIAQACHACSSTIHMFRDDPITVEYVRNLDRMHKIILEIPNEDALRALSQSLADASIDHKLWIEQPENIPTCLATKPYKKNVVQRYFKNLKLLK